MPDELQIALGQPHEEAIAFLRGKPPVTRATFDRMLPELRARAFTVTGIEGFSQLERIRDSIAGLASGTTWDEAKAEVIGQLDALGDGAARRAELLLRTHGFQAFQAANWETAQADIDTTHLQYLATEDDRVRDTHLALNGLILPKDDPWWDKHYPPWEWGCRCRVRPINPDLLEEARQRDDTVPPEDRYVMEGPVLERLRQGQLVRGGRAFDVTSPADRPGGDKAFQWHPGDLHLNTEQLKARYEPEIWSEFERWADGQEVLPRMTVGDWLARRPAPPASLAAEERHSARLHHEVGAAFAADGTPLWRKAAAERELTMTPAEAAAIEGRIFTHNHPSGQPPAFSDLKAFTLHGPVEMRVVTRDGTWILKAPEEGWRSKADRAEIWRQVNERLAAAALDRDRPIAERARTMLETLAARLGVRIVEPR